MRECSERVSRGVCELALGSITLKRALVATASGWLPGPLSAAPSSWECLSQLEPGLADFAGAGPLAKASITRWKDDVRGADLGDRKQMGVTGRRSVVSLAAVAAVKPKLPRSPRPVFVC